MATRQEQDDLGELSEGHSTSLPTPRWLFILHLYFSVIFKMLICLTWFPPK